MNNMIPVAMRVSKLNVLIVGFGKVGKRKALKYRAAGANITTVDPNVMDVDYHMDFTTYYKHYGIHFMKQHLVIICTDNHKSNADIALCCEQFAKLYNRTDQGEASLFTDMVTLEDEKALIAISSQEQSPYISKHLRTIIKPYLENDQVQSEIKWLAEQTKEAKENHETYDDVMRRWRLLHES
ncbi:NAD(P)-dependent oxidoreductase [Fusibacter bizertensis]|uniref:precorrin-2 dehydrogenase n=1 Tax=Fusibacter bizertensis TaxID=1488331 RepID=A0ABT6NH28_9FIRM|nr:NAD(P)-dependent oxidoreductase [Fusibacter bizertensis]MDH8679712.1 NAD(P)-dependent oxidoreductase [Fusibacter bizertensis]